MDTVCNLNTCTGCYACQNACSKNAIQIIDELETVNAVIDPEKCIKCGRCKNVCPNVSTVEKREPFRWVEGWTKDKLLRERSSSGGFAAAIVDAFLREGGSCYSCVFKDGDIRYSKVTSAEEIQGSKYVKSIPGLIFREIQHELKDGRKTLFVGLPCHVAGLINFIGNHENLYTVDLICHGSPSIKLLSKFLEQYDVNLSKVDHIVFRIKNDEEMEEFVNFSYTGIEDYYTFSFLKGLIYTENCYSCQYAGTKRCSDLTIGDSWGSKLPNNQVEKGISLGLCMTEKGQYLLDIAKLESYFPDVEVAIAHNKQLRAPMIKPDERNRFFNWIKDGMAFNEAVRKCYPKVWLKQDIKVALMKLRIKHGHSNYSLRAKIRN